MSEIEPGGPGSAAFSEKNFYLGEFRGRTLALAAPGAELRAPAPLEAVLKELAANATRVALISDEPGAFELLPDTACLASDGPRLEGAVWHELRASGRVGICVADAGDFAAATRRIALRLGVSKLVWIDRGGALEGGAGRRLSFADLAELRTILARGAGLDARRRSILREIQAALDAGLPAVNLCSLAGLADELFTYAGSGTLFSRERYVTVRRLGIDDFDAAADLIARGVAEGYLAPRTELEVEQVLANGFGAFVEGRHLAGIGALLCGEAGSELAEIASLYTLTRFAGEGIGAHLVAFACDRARERGHRSVFAVTTSDRVAGFFERNGFRRIGAEAVPAEKWRDYDPERRTRAHCLRRSL
jgi:amino-acid N-acetyltransferase